MLKALAPFWKAIAPAVFGALASLANALADGTFNGTSVKLAAGGVVAAILVYLVPNRGAAGA
jgi:hypothetical protein